MIKEFTQQEVSFAFFGLLNKMRVSGLQLGTIDQELTSPSEFKKLGPSPQSQLPSNAYLESPKYSAGCALNFASNFTSQLLCNFSNHCTYITSIFLVPNRDSYELRCSCCYFYHAVH